MVVSLFCDCGMYRAHQKDPVKRREAQQSKKSVVGGGRAVLFGCACSCGVQRPIAVTRRQPRGRPVGPVLAEMQSVNADNLD